MPTSFQVANQTDLNNAITQIDVGGASAAINTAYTITLTSSFTLSTDLWAINLASGSSLTVQGNFRGNNATIDGGGSQRGFFVYSGTVAINNLTITNAAAVGGAGASGGGGAGGGAGGMGAGGALFVASGGNVTLSNVVLMNSDAVGGAGGVGGPSAAFPGISPGLSGGGGGLGGNGGLGSSGSDGGGGGGAWGWERMAVGAV
jgi:hypothetical protein